MSFWEKLLRALGYHKATDQLPFEMDAGLVQSLQILAQQEKRSETEVASELLSFALAQRDIVENRLVSWQSLSPREQQVTALVCLGYTNREIAARLTISPETVKTHVRNALKKFAISSKAELRHVLAEWDFSAWHKTKP